MNNKTQIICSSDMLYNFLKALRPVTGAYSAKIENGYLTIGGFGERLSVESKEPYFQNTYYGSSLRTLTSILKDVSEQPITIEFNDFIEIKSLIL
ncbi:hypothetical protein [Dyadobacter bucti]|uniref:hypothetical protein n=1 Tax=Dyadobacter bucti TaxID=2572203 RepID=UPI00110846CA|nr:hypothetical protein [Dyadobacter bucti]